MLERRTLHRPTSKLRVASHVCLWQVEGADFRFQERMRGVIEYMQYREMPAEVKRKVRPRRGREENVVMAKHFHGKTLSLSKQWPAEVGRAARPS